MIQPGSLALTFLASSVEAISFVVVLLVFAPSSRDDQEGRGHIALKTISKSK